MRGRKPKLTFSETVKLRSIQAAFGVGSKEEDAFWENVRKAAKLRREIRRGSTPSARPKRVKKYATYAEAHRAANRSFYERNREKILEKRKADYYKKKELTEVKKR
jgi:hypothetical protein